MDEIFPMWGWGGGWFEWNLCLSQGKIMAMTLSQWIQTLSLSSNTLMHLMIFHKMIVSACEILWCCLKNWIVSAFFWQCWNVLRFIWGFIYYLSHDILHAACVRTERDRTRRYQKVYFLSCFLSRSFKIRGSITTLSNQLVSMEIYGNLGR